jgi:hypothetical protein
MRLRRVEALFSQVNRTPEPPLAVGEGSGFGSVES